MVGSDVDIDDAPLIQRTDDQVHEETAETAEHSEQKFFVAVPGLLLLLHLRKLRTEMELIREFDLYYY